MKHCIGVLLAAICTGSILNLPLSRADEPAAEALVKEGLELRRAGRDLDALGKLKEAHNLSPVPKIAAQLGLCEQAVGQWAEAEAHLSAALSASTDAWVLKNRQILKDQLEIVKQHVARIEIFGSPSGAEVLVNGAEVGKLPLGRAVSVDEGQVSVEVRAPRHQPFLRTLELKGSQYQRIAVTLEPSVVAAQPAPAPSMPLLPAAETTPHEQPEGSTSLWWWALGGVVAVGAIATAVALSLGGSEDLAPVDRRETF